MSAVRRLGLNLWSPICNSSASMPNHTVSPNERSVPSVKIKMLHNVQRDCGWNPVNGATIHKYTGSWFNSSFAGGYYTAFTFLYFTTWQFETVKIQLQFKGKLQNLTHLLLLNAKACFLLGQLPSLWARLFRRTSSANFAVEPWSCWVIGQVYSCSFSELKVTLYFSSCVQNRWWMTNRLK